MATLRQDFHSHPLPSLSDLPLQRTFGLTEPHQRLGWAPTMPDLRIRMARRAKDFFRIWNNLLDRAPSHKNLLTLPPYLYLRCPCSFLPGCIYPHCPGPAVKQPGRTALVHPGADNPIAFFAISADACIEATNPAGRVDKTTSDTFLRYGILLRSARTSCTTSG